MSYQQPWTLAEQETLADLIDRGLTLYQISIAMGRSANSVKGKMYACRFTLRNRGAEFAETHTVTAYDAALRRRWAAMIPGLKAALRADIAAIGGI